MKHLNKIFIFICEIKHNSEYQQHIHINIFVKYINYIVNLQKNIYFLNYFCENEVSWLLYKLVGTCYNESYENLINDYLHCCYLTFICTQYDIQSTLTNNTLILNINYVIMTEDFNFYCSGSITKNQASRSFTTSGL